ncbi:heat-inducible transcription repressor HrcA [candidate division KSB1 bacterium]|nr:heat-inducible transcription repressor HrcA [candidate division KSB1 bacterium]
MQIEDLSERERQVFLSIVHGFIRTAEPVGSRYLAKNYNLNISPATIRNVMMDLEEKGLISQPHTSAGRVPTTSGYRQYVNDLMSVQDLDEVEKISIISQLEIFSKDVNLIIQKATEVLSKISSQLGVVLTPRFNQGKLKKIDLVTLSDSKLLVILNVKSGLVKTVIVEIDKSVPANLIDTTSQLINERLHDLSLEELQDSIDTRFNDVDRDIRVLIDAIRKKSELLKFDYEGDFHFAGARNVISQPEFENREKIGKILELLDRKDILIKILDGHESEGVSIVIGDENQEDLMKNCSLITTSYNFDNAKGTLGIIGPTRMQYSKIIALVEFMAETLSYLIMKNNN